MAQANKKSIEYHIAKLVIDNLVKDILDNAKSEYRRELTKKDKKIKNE